MDQLLSQLLSKKLLVSKLTMALLASTVVLTACSNETEERTDTEASETVSNDTTIESSEMTPVHTDDATTTTTISTEGEDAEAYYSTVGGAEDEQEVDDTVYVNENNSNLDQTPADGVQ